jgi:hypothetical protein
MIETEGIPPLFTVWDTPVKVKPIVYGHLLAGWLGLSWLAGRRRPRLSWIARLLIGAASLLAMISADLGHAIAHIVSARYAGAPMDEIYVSETLSHTLYREDDVPPDVHRLRALGGPIFSAVGLAASLLFRSRTPPPSVARVVADAACLGHGYVLGGSLLPLPIVDGGSILKWTLVKRGLAPARADAALRQANLALGTAATTAGVTFALSRRWLPALGLVAAGAAALAAAVGKIR